MKELQHPGASLLWSCLKPALAAADWFATKLEDIQPSFDADPDPGGIESNGSIPPSSGRVRLVDPCTGLKFKP